MSDKKKRSDNFNKTEIDILVDIVFKYKEIIENKRTNAIAWAEKRKAWEDVAEEFNSVSGNFPRSSFTLKLKYEGLKKEIKKKYARIKENASMTGSSSSEIDFLSCYEEKILSMIQFSITGLQSAYDCDEPSKIEDMHSCEERNTSATIDIKNLVPLKKRVLLLQATLLEEEIESKRRSGKFERQILEIKLESEKIELEIKRRKLEEMKQ